MRFLKENDELKIYKITYCCAYCEDESDCYDMEYDRDFPGYTLVYARDLETAERLFNQEFATHEIMTISEISKEDAERVKASVDYVDFYS